MTASRTDEAHAIMNKLWNMRFPLGFLKRDCDLVNALVVELARIRAEALKEASAEIEKLKGQRDRAVKALRELRRSHRICEDNWYSCPQSGECINDSEGEECNCGAQEHNAIIDDAIAEIEGGE